MNTMRGFTLIELVIVLFIVGMVLALTLPNLPDLSGTRLKSTSKKIAGTIKFIRSRAVVEKKILLLVMDIDQGSYRVKTPVKKGNTVELIEYKADFSVKGSLVNGVSFEDIVTAKNGKMDAGEVAITFSPRGFVEKSTIHLTDSRNSKMTLFIHPVVGRVRIVDGYAE